jgi:hypothetical protein
LINMIVAELEDDAGREVVRVSARRASAAHELLDLVADALGGEGAAASDDRLQAAYLRLSAAALSRPDALVVVDDVAGAFGHQVFGRMRDELWELGLHWLVSGRADDEAVLLAPPADAFFETVHRVQPLSAAHIETLLDRRDADAQLSGELRHRIAERAAGNPARALELARRSIVSDDHSALQDVGVLDRAAEELGRPAARLVDELLRSGPASPSDPALLERLGWSSSRAYQVFAQLERAGYVTAAAEHSGRPGRPRKLFRVVESS